MRTPQRETYLVRETLAVSRRGLRALVRLALTGKPDTYDAPYQATVLVDRDHSVVGAPPPMLGVGRFGRPRVVVPESFGRPILIEIKELPLS